MRGTGEEAEGEVGVDRLVVELRLDQPAREHALQLRAEEDEIVALRPVERLHPEPVAGQHRPPPLPVPDRDRELAPQQLRIALPLALVQVRQDLGVAAAREPVPILLQLPVQLEMVVQLPVLGRPDRPLLVPHRLMAAGHIHDRQAPRPQRHPRRLIRAPIIRPPMRQHIRHPVQHTRREHRPRLTTNLNHPTNPAHAPTEA